MLKFFSRLERERRKRDKERQALCKEMISLQRLSDYCDRRLTAVLNEIKDIDTRELVQSFPTRRVRGW